MNVDTPALAAFAGYGIELEYMIVGSSDLSPLPIADQLLRTAVDVEVDVCNVDHGMMGWSNELVLHVIEIKNQRPTPHLDILPGAFQTEVQHINRILGPLGARLMPTAMHPWMKPGIETQLWPHDNAALYQAYGAIFDCNTHGWANLQSMHINLPFANDGEFARLHAAIRLMLPILPALAASSPIAEGRTTGFADFRMEAYRTNAKAIASIAGLVIPETVSTRADYEQKILAPMYRDIAALDPQRLLQYEWLNSRGAIARFDRNAIEIRVIDTQECPQADLAIAAAVIAMVRTLYDEQSSPLEAQQKISTEALASLFLRCIQDADQAIIDDAAYLALLGYPGRQCIARDLWQHLLQTIQRSNRKLPDVYHAPLQTIMEHGPLARRILRAINGNTSGVHLETTPLETTHLQTIYRQLCDCLQQGRMFLPS